MDVSSDMGIIRGTSSRLHGTKGELYGSVAGIAETLAEACLRGIVNPVPETIRGFGLLGFNSK